MQGREIVKDLYDYNLPEDRIAQRPVKPRDSSKLLVVDRESGSLSQRVFKELPNYLRKGDLLLFNDTKVDPVRLFGTFEDSGGEIELLILEDQGEGIRLCMGRPLRKFKEGRIVRFSSGLIGTVRERVGSNLVKIEFSLSSDEDGSLTDELISVGGMPIPPYIRGGRGDKEDLVDYQPLLASESGSVAAPTASLHFTEELFKEIFSAGVEIGKITLHVGPPSFLQLWGEDEKVEDIESPGTELFRYSSDLLRRIEAVKKNGGRVIGVGTTSVRCIESMAVASGSEGELLETDLIIQPGYQFQIIDHIITNFHQPRTTHMLLMQAVLGRELLERSYQYALSNEFRFLSYGDGMLVI